MRYSISTILVAVVLVSGCDQKSPAAGDASVQPQGTRQVQINQANLCEVKDWTHDSVVGSCEPGQKIVFLPNRWGNEQLPIIFAAVNCDMRHNIALTNGGVVCIYAPIKPEPAPEERVKQEPATPSKP